MLRRAAILFGGVRQSVFSADVQSLLAEELNKHSELVPKKIRDALEEIEASGNRRQGLSLGRQKAWRNQKDKPIQQLLAPRNACVGCTGRLKSYWMETERVAEAAVQLESGEVLYKTAPSGIIKSLLICHCCSTAIAHTVRKRGLVMGEGNAMWVEPGVISFTTLPTETLPSGCLLIITARVTSVTGWKSTVEFDAAFNNKIQFRGSVTTVRAAPSLTPDMPPSIVPRCGCLD